MAAVVFHETRGARHDKLLQAVFVISEKAPENIGIGNIGKPGGQAVRGQGQRVRGNFRSGIYVKTDP
jgi:hypothetical protein